MASNACTTLLPEYTLKPLPPLLPWISDFHLSLLCPFLAYWLIAGIYFVVDTFDLFPSYKLHTPAEFRQRNRIAPATVIRSVLTQQFVQTAFGVVLGQVLGTEEVHGKEDYDLALWSIRVQSLRHRLPLLLGLLGVDGTLLSAKVGGMLESVSWTRAPELTSTSSAVLMPSLAKYSSCSPSAWDVFFARLVFHFLEPSFRFMIAVLIADTWQYWWHRAMHMNKWLYRNVHSMHHRIYCPYAYGAFLNTLTEIFILDTIGTTLALTFSGLTTRQALCFSTLSVMKGVDDHSGYQLPWNPLQWLSAQTTSFHDVHHQSWGIKTNFSQLYLTIWDHIGHTVCPLSSEELEKIYEAHRRTAEDKEAMTVD